MEKKNKRFILSFLVGILVASLIPIGTNEVSAATDITPLKYHKDRNYRYFVGMFYYDMWKDSAGNWTDGGRQPNKGMRGEASFTYRFQFPNRKIKDVEARIYTTGDPEVYFSDSRFDTYNDYEKHISIGTSDSDIKPFSKQGIGTDTTTIPITVNMLLDAERPQDIKDQLCPTCAPNVEAFRIYLPILFKIELATQLNVKYFTVNGHPLDVFTPRLNEEMTVGTHYEFIPPTNDRYEYVGYKKTTMDGDPGGDIIERDPDSFTYNGSHEKYTLFMYYKLKGSEDKPPGVECTTPSPGQTMAGEDFYPDVSAVIKADSRWNEAFNVLDGIPTTESLYGNVWAKEYLHLYDYQEMIGTCTFTVNVTVMPPPPEPGEDPGEEPEGSVVQVVVDKEYSFWTIQQVEVYKIEESDLWNYAFDGNGIRIRPVGYYEPYYATAETHAYEPSPIPEDIQVSFDGDPEEAARNAVSVRVSNDTFTLNGQTLMDGMETEESGPIPYPIPMAPMIGDNVLYSPGNVIPMTKTNKAYQPSSGAIYYVQVNGYAELNYPIYGINDVTVHTPVVIYPDVSDDREHNQKTRPAARRSAIILDRPFTIEMPNSGQHTNYLGYGYRNYLKYIGSKQVRFPFDVYDGTQTRFYPKNTWIEVEKSQESFTFFLPVWVDEGFYDVEFRTIAHNAPYDASHQTNANLDLTHHIAYDTVPVDAIGRVYDFRITDIADYNWESVFREAKGSVTPTGAAYWVELNDIDGNPRGNTQRYTLPIRLGSHPFYKNVSIKTGYHFKFDFKTKGNMMDQLDGVRITPTFYFVTNDGRTRVPVDLYYHTNTKNFIKVGSTDDKVERYVILNHRLRNVSATELTDTASYKYDHYWGTGLDAASKSQYIDKYIHKYTQQKTPVGWFRLLVLPEQLRTFIGPKTTYLGQSIPASVDRVRTNVSVQKWYGEYSLPAAPYVVQKDVNIAEWGRQNGGLNDKSPIFLKSGYIIVNFNIETIQDGDMDYPHLQYIHAPAMQPTGSQWELEGYQEIVRDSYGYPFQLQQGDVVFYHANKSSRDDFHSTVPH
ncbi:DUF5704 domain-containing protein [Paenibacillus ihumii]|uniref:DUF5704 domain-containing protein n=1 Tax=Paenibacillus ihumii TaxID=687436 RepID=UPI00093C765B|nr:DUF5704 domain-containing protein [Paenibacillus ihumii]